MSQPATMGVFAGLCIQTGSPPYTWDTSAKPFAFFREDLKKQGTIWNPDFIRGTRSACATRSREGAYTVGGPVILTTNPLDLAVLLPLIMGAGSGNSFTLTEALPAFGVLINRVEQTFEYTQCFVNSALFRSRASANPNDPAWVELTLDIWGTDENTGVEYPAVTVDCSSAAYQPYVFSDGVITLKSATRNMMNFAILIENHLERRYTNSLAATSIRPSDRTVRLRTTNPFTSDEIDLYNQQTAGYAGTLVLTNGSYSTTFNFADLQVPPESPVVGGKTEIPLYLDMISRATSSLEVAVTNVSS